MSNTNGAAAIIPGAAAEIPGAAAEMPGAAAEMTELMKDKYNFERVSRRETSPLMLLLLKKEDYTEEDYIQRPSNFR